jgi:hypothetical protein
MKQRFGTPYVFFEKFISPEHIGKAYHDLFEFLGVPEPDELDNLKAEAEMAVEKGRR